MNDLEGRLATWIELGFVTPEQAERIREHEGSGPTRPPAAADAPPAATDAPPAARRRTAVAEAVGYVGAALALAAIGLFVGDVWPQLATAGRLALVGLLTVLAGGAGFALHRQPAAAMQRLTGVLWGAMALGGAWFAGIVAAEVLDADPRVVALSAAIAGAVLAVPTLLLRPGVPLQVVALGSLVATATSALALAPLEPDPFWFGALVSALGGAWLLLGRGGWLPPARVAEIIGAGVALLGAQVASFRDARELALAIGVAIAAVLVALAIGQEAEHHLVIGAIGLFVLVPQLVFELFGDAIGAPATLLVVGLLLVLLAVGLGRARREVAGRASDVRATTDEEASR